jgi:hypothetical protein
MRLTLLFALLLGPGLCFAQAFEAPLAASSAKNNYAEIEFMSAARSSTLAPVAEELPAATPREQALRLVVYRSEIYQSLAIETITTGLEGCCAKVDASRTMDLQAFATHFGFKGELAGFAFSGWTSPNAFRFTFNGKPFSATVLNRGKRVRIERETGR